MKKTIRFVCLFLALVMLCGLSACAGLPASGKNSEKIYPVPACYDEDDNAVLYFGPDALLKFKDTKTAYVTGDKKNLVWLTTDGELYIAPNKNEKTDLKSGKLLEEDVDRINGIRNPGFLYTTKDGTLFQYLFDSGRSYEVAKDVDSITLSYDFSSVYYASDGKVCRFFSGDSEKIGSYDRDDTKISFKCVSDDGSWVVWSVYTNTEIVMYSYNGMETDKIKNFTNDSDYHSGYAVMNKSQDQVLAYSNYDTSVFLLSRDGDPDEIRFKENVDLSTSFHRYFSKGSEKISGVYAQVKNGDFYDLWWGNTDGDTEKLFKEVRDYGVSGKKLFYITEDEELYETDAKEDKTDSGERIAKDVGAMDTAPADGIVYYMKNCESVDFSDAEGTLYVYKSGDKEPTKIASGVYMSYYKYYSSRKVSAYTQITLVDKGNAVFYMKNYEEDDNYLVHGDLYCYKIGSKEPVKVMSDTVQYFYFYEEDYDSDSVYLAKYESSDKDETYVSWYYYDGKETHLIIKDSTFW